MSSASALVFAVCVASSECDVSIVGLLKNVI